MKDVNGSKCRKAMDTLTRAHRVALIHVSAALDQRAERVRVAARGGFVQRHRREEEGCVCV
jgi:hypothetical protein